MEVVQEATSPRQGPAAVCWEGLGAPCAGPAAAPQDTPGPWGGAASAEAALHRSEQAGRRAQHTWTAHAVPHVSPSCRKVSNSSVMFKGGAFPRCLGGMEVGVRPQDRSAGAVQACAASASQGL